MKQNRQQGVVTKTYAGGTSSGVGITRRATVHPTAQSANQSGDANRVSVYGLLATSGTPSATPCLSLTYEGIGLT